MTVHMLEPDPHLPYQVFARDSSVMTPSGAIVTQPAQRWRRGEYAPVIRFYQDSGIPIAHMITAGSLGGRRRHDRRAGLHADRQRRGAHPGPGCGAARGLAASRGLGGADRADPGAVRPHRRPGFDPGAEARGRLRGIRVGRTRRVAAGQGVRDPRGLDRGRVPARRQRDLAGRRPRDLDAALGAAERCDPRPRARGAGPRPLRVHRRRRWRPLPRAGPAARRRAEHGRWSTLSASSPTCASSSAAPATSAARSASAGRETWSAARGFLGELLDELGLEPEADEAGNLWARLEGSDPAAPALAVGSHLDSVPDGGWLDGALGVMAAVGVLRAHADSEPARPARARRLGRRGGGALRAEPVRQLGVRGNPRARRHARS